MRIEEGNVNRASLAVTVQFMTSQNGKQTISAAASLSKYKVNTYTNRPGDD